MAIEINLKLFTGPLDLLLHLIKSNEMDIYDIRIVEITEQYLEAIEQMKRLDLDIAGEFLLMAADIARSHHERYDGTGYPDGLAGNDIPLPARIVAVADVFDALTSRRVYKDEQAVQEAREIILQESGRHFDPHVVAAFERCYEGFLRVKDADGAPCNTADYVIQ